MRYLLISGAEEPRPFGCLSDAMAAAGHPATADWALAAVGDPDRIITSRRAGPLPWQIDAPGVGHDLVDAATSGGCMHHVRPWSRCDPAIIDVVVGYFQDSGIYLPILQAWQVAARIAGHFAAAAELTRTRITAAIRSAYDASGLDCSASLADRITGQVTQALRRIGVAVYDDRPASGDLADLAGLPAAPCQVYPGPAEGSPAGEHLTLAAAMAATGHPGYDGWQVSPDDTGQISWPAPDSHGDTARPGWVIRAPGIARLYAEACPDGVRVRRRWSGADGRITGAVSAVLGAGTGPVALPARSAGRVGSRLAAQYATGGLAAEGVLAALLDVCGRAGLEPPLDAVDRVAARIAVQLAEAGIPVAGTAAAVVSPAAAGPPVQPAPAAARPGRPAQPRRPAGPAAGSACRPGRRMAGFLDSVFWCLTAPLEDLFRAPRRPGRMRRLRAVLLAPICGLIIFAGPPAAVSIVLCQLPWRWQCWLALALTGAVIPARTRSSPRSPRNSDDPLAPPSQMP